MKTLWQHVKDIFSSKFKKESTPQLEKQVESQIEVIQPVIQTIEIKEQPVQSEVKEDIKVVEDTKPDVVEIKIEHIKEDPPKRKRAVKKETVVEVTPTTVKKRGPKKSKKT